MRHYLKWLPVVFGALILESTLLDFIKFRGAKPDLLLVVVVFIALLGGSAPAAKMGFVLGLAEDIFAGKYLGLHALSKAAIGYLVGLGENKIYKENVLVPVLGVMSATIVYEIIFVNLARWGGANLQSEGFFQAVWPIAVYNGFVALLLYSRFSKAAESGWFKVTRTPPGVARRVRP